MCILKDVEQPNQQENTESEVVASVGTFCTNVLSIKTMTNALAQPLDQNPTESMCTV